MKTVIIEDEYLAAESLEKLLLNSHFDIEIVKRLESVRQAIEWFEKNSCDLIFSDIHLGDGESFEIFDALDIKTPIIFTTAFDKYAIQSFNHFALDYLLKPYNKDKLNLSIKKYLDLSKSPKQQDNRLEELLLKMNNSNKAEIKQERFLVNLGNELKSINSDDIAYFMAEDKYLFLCTKSGRSYIYEDTISNLEQKLSLKNFFKINRKYIISHNAIKNIYKYSRNRIKIEFITPSDSKEIILVSSKNKNAFKDWLNC